jgi:hypothetical protein
MKTFPLVAGVALILAPSAFSQDLIASSIRTETTSPTSCITALGASSYAASNGVAIGARAYAGPSALALGGYYSDAHGYSAFVLAGYENKAYGDYSAAIGGYGNNAAGTYSYALGNMAEAWSDASLAYGYYAATSSDYSMALGSKNLSSYTYGGLFDGWVEDSVLFELGNGAPDGYDHYRSNLSNAITTLKNGQTTLTNKAWLNRDSGTSATADPSSATTDSGGEALVVEGHTRLKGKVIIEEAQGDISMGIYQ